MRSMFINDDISNFNDFLKIQKVIFCEIHFCPIWTKVKSPHFRGRSSKIKSLFLGFGYPQQAKYEITLSTGFHIFSLLYIQKHCLPKNVRTEIESTSVLHWQKFI